MAQEKPRNHESNRGRSKRDRRSYLTIADIIADAAIAIGRPFDDLMDMTLSQIRLILEADKRREARRELGFVQSVYAGACGLFGNKGAPVFKRAIASLRRIVNGEYNESRKDTNAKFINAVESIERNLKTNGKH